MATSPDTELFLTKDLTERWGISYMTLHRLKRDDPDFPPQYRIGGRDFTAAADLRSYLEKKKKTKPAPEATSHSSDDQTADSDSEDQSMEPA